MHKKPLHNSRLTKNFTAATYRGGPHAKPAKAGGPGRFMLEPIMYASIGFLAAGLLLVAFAPLIHERAVRLTVRRLHAATPPSFAELRIEKDLLRAEFAMSLRRLEVSLEQTKKKEV